MGFMDWNRRRLMSTDGSESELQTAPEQMAQPQQKYKFEAYKPPRVDNSNQPWYGSKNRSFLAGPDTVQHDDVVTSAPSVADVVTSTPAPATFSLDSIWASLASFFGGMSAKQNLMDPSGVIPPTAPSADPATIGVQQNQLRRRPRPRRMQ